MKLLTITWSYEPYFQIEKTNLYKSFKKYNPQVELVHVHFNRGDYRKIEQEYVSKFSTQGEYILYKVVLLRDIIKNLDTDYVIFCDANDVVCLSPIDGLLNFYDLDNNVIIGHEKNQWPMPQRKSEWQGYKDYSGYDSLNSTYLNSGVILSKKDKYIELLNKLIDNVLINDIKTFGGDQGVFTYYYNTFNDLIKLDYAGVLVVNTYLRNVNEYYLNGSSLVSNSTGVKPYFLHDNGWEYGSPRYRTHFNIESFYTGTFTHLNGLSKQTPIPIDHKNYLLKIRDEFGYTPKVIYDVGACVLHWTNLAKEIWPNSEYYLFDAMEESYEVFELTPHQYHIGVLSDVDNKEITFYKNTVWPGGNSYYKENPQYSGMADHLFSNKENQFVRRTVTLDSIRKLRNFKYPDLLKIDVQGCEVDILYGSKDILNYVNHLIVELQDVEYNIGSKRYEESVQIIESMGFELVTPRFSMNGSIDGDYHFVKKK
jgi:FkbM family methyltransferase